MTGESSGIDFAWRRQTVFLCLSGFFLGTLAFLNVVGISRFLDLSFDVFGVSIPLAIAVGVLPYPITFICTDLISELFGEKKAKEMVWIGLILNLWVLLILWLGGVLPGFENIDPGTGSPVLDEAGRLPVFFEVRDLAFGAVAASMIAYLLAQLCDVRLFHFFKKLTGGKHLWLRNTASTSVSQVVDTTAVILVTHFYAGALPIMENEPLWSQLLMFIAGGYLFKFLIALLDTPLIYLARGLLIPYLGLKENEEATSL